MLFYDVQIEWIRNLQAFASHPLIRTFFDALRFFDSFTFYFLLVPIIWLGFSRSWGIRFYYLLLVEVLVLHFLKDLFAEPRPYLLDFDIALASVGGYGFPSGGATAAMLFSYLLIFYHREKIWIWILAINYGFWVSLSRVYLGVHFFSDILGGWVLGAVLAFLFTRKVEKIEQFFQTHHVLIGFFASQVFAALFLFLKRSQIEAAFSAFGVGAGLVICSIFYRDVSYVMAIDKNFFIRLLLGLLGMLILAIPSFTHPSFWPLTYYTMGLLISFFIWPLYKKLKLA